MADGGKDASHQEAHDPHRNDDLCPSFVSTASAFPSTVTVLALTRVSVTRSVSEAARSTNGLSPRVRFGRCTVADGKKRRWRSPPVSSLRDCAAFACCTRI